MKNIFSKHNIKNIIFLTVAIFPFFSFAITLDKSVYYINEPMYFGESGGPTVVYDLSTGNRLSGEGSHDSGQVVSVDKEIDHNYSILETTTDGICEDMALGYAGCKSRPEFVGEFLFRVIARPTGGGSSGGGGGPTAYRPEVKIISPLSGKDYGNIVEINYEATDKNDEAGQPELGMRENSVSIYYSKTSDIRQKIQIGANLPAKGVFKWDTKDIPEGDTYRILIEATDKSNEMGWSATDEFGIDHTIPFFTVKTEPNATRGEDVKIIINSTKELAEIPTAAVRQNEFRAIPLELKGEKDHFEGIYKVISGYDGPAEIKIKGIDLSGNESSSIISGGFFSVGILPPPKPLIISPLDKEIISSEFVNVKGKARGDTEVILIVNGSEKYVVFPDKGEDFIFSHIKLKADFNRGLNFLNIISVDAAKNQSEPAIISLKFNIEPVLSVVSPVSGQKVSETTEILLDVFDKNRDVLNFIYEISRDGGKNWTLLNSSKNKRFLWDTSDSSDGVYSLRVTADDGFSKKISKVDGIIVENLSPAIFFTDGDSSNINKDEYLLKGTASVSDKISGVSLNALEYSLDGGNNWTSADPDDGSFNSAKESFSASLTNLEEKKYRVIFRAKDGRGVYGKAVKNLIVDFGPPLPPAIENISNGDILNMSFDTDKEKEGLQIVVSGRAEPSSVINAVAEDKTYVGIADRNGNFKVSGVHIPVHGENRISLFAIDGAGNKSEKSGISVRYNNPPIVTFINPRMGRGLNHRAEIKFDVKDPDFDPIKSIVLSYRENSAAPFKILAKDPPNNSYIWDVGGFPSSKDYELKVEAGDGISSVSMINKIFIDNTSPKANIQILKSKEFNNNWTFEADGYASDDFSGVEYVEYSLDEDHWFKAMITGGYLARNATFKIKHPFDLPDGNYKLSYRSVDAAGNISQIKSEDIRVDTTAPRVGSFILTSGSINLYPENGEFIIPENIKLMLKVSLESDTLNAVISLNGQDHPLLKNNSSGLWEREFDSGGVGGFQIKVSASDTLGNKTEGKKIADIKAVKDGTVKDGTGKPIAGASITAYVFDFDKQDYAPWRASSYGMVNPVKTDAKGRYMMLLPQGKYQLRIKAAYFVNIKTTEFVLKEPKFINLDFVMQPQEGIRGFIDTLLKKIMIFQYENITALVANIDKVILPEPLKVFKK